MVIQQQVDRVMRTYGKKLPSREDRILLRNILDLCDSHSHACSRAVKLVPMRSILMAIVLEREKMLRKMLEESQQAPMIEGEEVEIA